MTPNDLRQALPRFHQFIQRFAPLLGDDSRPARAEAYLRGLLLDAEDNKTAEGIALKVHGDPSQVRMTQVFISQSPWLDEPLRQDLAKWAEEEVGSDDAVLIVDEGSFLKCGSKSVGVARQYRGCVGKVANGQVAVYLAYGSRHGHLLLDTRLYLPEEWCADPERRAQAGVPKEVVFRTKPELGLELVCQLCHLRHGWVTFDEGYGRNQAFLSGLEELGERYVGEVPKDTRGWLQRPALETPVAGRKGRPPSKPRVAAGEPAPQTVEALVAALPASAWKRSKVRDGSKGVQFAEFARVRFVVERDNLPGPELWLLVERSCDQQAPFKYYLSNAAVACPLTEMIRAAHSRWMVEDCFLRGKDEVGLDEYEVRGWRGWHHHMTLAMLALWFLVLEKRRLGGKTGHHHDVA
jgi:SRSO17 transposase